MKIYESGNKGNKFKYRYQKLGCKRTGKSKQKKIEKNRRQNSKCQDEKTSPQVETSHKVSFTERGKIEYGSYIRRPLQCMIHVVVVFWCWQKKYITGNSC